MYIKKRSINLNLKNIDSNVFYKSANNTINKFIYMIIYDIKISFIKRT